MVRLTAATAAIALLALSGGPAGAVEGLPPGVTAKQLGHGWVFGDSRGMTLYTYDRDEETPGKSNCKADCATAWPPLLAPADAQPQGAWSLIPRDDGAKQWAYRGKPLYTYASDAFPGATFGDGVDTVWWAALQHIPAPPEVRIGATMLGQVLTDTRGRTLYTYERDKDGKSACDKDCTKTWRPVLAPWLANASGDWSLVRRDDGTRQWAFKGKPLYAYAGDVNPGEALGAREGKDWKVTVLEPAPPLPPFVTVQASDAGDLLANREGRTLYARQNNPRLRRFANPNCPECVDPQWIPVIADADAKPVGSWLLVDLPDGRKQWTYKGMRVHTHVLDEKPGDFKGIRFGGDRSWGAIMRNGAPMQGVTVGG